MAGRAAQPPRRPCRRRGQVPPFPAPPRPMGGLPCLPHNVAMRTVELARYLTLTRHFARGAGSHPSPRAFLRPEAKSGFPAAALASQLRCHFIVGAPFSCPPARARRYSPAVSSPSAGASFAVSSPPSVGTIGADRVRLSGAPLTLPSSRRASFAPRNPLPRGCAGLFCGRHRQSEPSGSGHGFYCGALGASPLDPRHARLFCPARAALPRTHARGSFLWARNRATLA